MAINPNTDFTTGQVLTADQANRWPRGVMALATSTTDDTSITAEEVQLTATFTAVANRYYKISYQEPYLYLNAGTSEFQVRIRQTNLAGTILQFVFVPAYSTQGNSGSCFVVKTFAAGSQTVVATLQVGTNTGTADRSATSPAVLLVEDLGPA